MSFRTAGVLPALACAFALLPACAGASIPSARVHFAAEDARLRAHFAVVLAELSRHAPEGLTDSQRAARTAHLRALEAYARAGRFPRNHGEAPGPTPIFVDRDGNRCAMAHLIEASGRADLAGRVARTDNLICILDLEADPELTAWLERAGLSLEEAARIQPAYWPQPKPEETNDPDSGVMTSSALLGFGLCGPAIFLNMRDGGSRPQRISNIVLGTVAGGAVAAAGIADWSDDSHLRGAGYLALTLGVTSIVMSQVNLWRGGWPKADDAGAPDPDAAHANDARPGWNTGLRMSPEGVPQMAVRLGF